MVIITKKKTLAEHIEYLEETVKLSLWAAAEWKKKKPDEEFAEIIHKRTSLVSHTSFNLGWLYDEPRVEGGDWPSLLLKLQELYTADNGSESFEKNGFELLKDCVRPRAEHDLEVINNHQPDSWIAYDLEAQSPHFDNRYLEIHMENSLYPNSFLADEDYFVSGLNKALKDAKEHGFIGLWSFSWLNDLPAWQAKMPAQWTRSIQKRVHDIEWHLGFWGQFLTARQCFNHQRAAQFRKTKKLPLAPSIAFAKLEDF